MSAIVAGLSEIDPRSAVLLLGSGFSYGSKNLRASAPPNGSALRQHFITELGLPADTTYDLQVLAEEVAHTAGKDLYQELYDLFTISESCDYHRGILKEHWLRIYTTNYDDLVEFCHQEERIRDTPLDSSDPLPNKIGADAVIHLHGSIRRLTDEDVLQQLVLGEASYVRQYIHKSHWYTQMQGDLRFASALFIIGYSLSDYHISALLLENPRLAERTFFIQSPTIDPIFQRRTKSYGQTLFIGVQGFADLVKSLPRPAPIPDIGQLRAFKRLDPFGDRQSRRAPTALEVQNLLIFGSFSYKRFASAPDDSYVISRPVAMTQFLESFETNRTTLVESRLGNGKTIFLNQAALVAAEKGYTVFQFTGSGPQLQREIDALKSIPKLVILFTEYAAAQDVLSHLAEDLPQARFVVEIRSSIFEVRFHEVSKLVPKPYGRINLNKLSSDEARAFDHLCSQVGISSKPHRGGAGALEMRDMLLHVLESPNIRSKIESYITPIFSNPKKKKVLLLSMLLSRFHLSADAGFIKAVTGLDPYHEFYNDRGVSGELFETNSDEFKIRSAIFCDYAVQSILDASEVADCVYEAAIAASSRKDDRTYRILMSNLMQFSNIEELFRKERHPMRMVIGMYERLRHDDRINDEPLFWLQYAIAAAEDNELRAAEEFIGTSYDRAALRAGFRTYQIDTQALRIFLLIETTEKAGTPIVRMQKIIQSMSTMESMLREESHRSFAIKVLGHIEPFIQHRQGDMTTPEKVKVVYWLSRLAESLDLLPIEFKTRTGSDLVKNDLNRSRELLVR